MPHHFPPPPPVCTSPQSSTIKMHTLTKATYKKWQAKPNTDKEAQPLWKEIILS